MTYYRYSTPLGVKLSTPESRILCARLRAIQGVFSAVVVANKLNIWYRGVFPAARVKNLLDMTTMSYKKHDDAPEMADYRREATLSVGGLIAMQLLKRLSPEAFASVQFLRSAMILYIARNFIKNGVRGLVKENRPNADTLTATAVIASVLAGKPESSLSLLALSNGAEMLTSYAAEKARGNISGLLNMNQPYVWLVDNGVERKVPVKELKIGDIIAVHTGEKICIDGQVLSGTAAVNQASITGESAPAMKKKGLPVYAGSVVEAGEIVVKAEKVGDDTSLAHIVHLVEEAQTRKAPVQNFADTMANLLVPISFLGAAIVYGATRDWQRVLNLLFIDFSCGLKLSTATAISAAIGAAAKQGILVKGGNYIEALADTDTVVLDKTGTITSGVPQVSTIHTVPGVEEKEMLLLAASAEQHSVHPLAVAIQKYVKDKSWTVPQHKSSKTIVARGMTAVVPDFEKFIGGEIIVGSAKLMYERDVKGMNITVKDSPGMGYIYVARDGVLLGVIGINDPIRPMMKKTLNQMRRYGVDEVVMLTGDSKTVASEVARDMDIDSYHAEVLPEDKAKFVMKLKKQGTVMMVGDGINDAPALAFANVGVTLGGRQTDLAAESSAVTIRSEDPTRLIEALRLGRRTMDLIHQNFTATITVNSAAMLLGALGVINPLWAAVIHNTATLAVVLNSARILVPDKKRAAGPSFF
ncbi:MAG: heavy metal translocating P-type ATPase [Anaerovibrio sp.]|uniref:heavy metal translocating P-type ATPase n=1 Tax=Anaerovibrio sp. TaxID=1872532 RepID=UPI0025D106EC|nr:heavy metal translocating P-type ATPase [Anaerovibrio sp.]MCR5176944.1 heavy metal translocating P-type ATPase [Anaerovibrio sp.]